MIEDRNGDLRRKFRILVAPLDWGLGHATRCVPIIKELLVNNCEVWLAGEGMQETLLRSEFPSLPFLSLQGYRIRYSKSMGGLFWSIFLQVPRIIFAIRKEHGWLKKIQKEYEFDVIISDNRFGLCHRKIRNIFITHQLNIKSPLGSWNERLLQKLNYRYITRFSECWIPDNEEEDNLAGELSHPDTGPPILVKYIGLLSRFEIAKNNEKKGHLLFILSGPEPQRSILENKIIDEISHYNGSATIVRGLPSALSVIPSTGMIKFYNHLSAKELNEEIEKAEWVISRSGYSTVMDLARLQKKSILIPTPGQTEQEYLGKYLSQKNLALTIKQSEFSLNKTLEKAEKFNFRFSLVADSKKLSSIIKDLLSSLRKLGD